MLWYMLCLHPSPSALSVCNSVLALETPPHQIPPRQVVFVCQDCQFQQYIILTRMLASSSSSHSLGSFPSFSRVGCKEDGCVKLTEPHWTLLCAAPGQSSAALVQIFFTSWTLLLFPIFQPILPSKNALRFLDFGLFLSLASISLEPMCQLCPLTPDCLH